MEPCPALPAQMIWQDLDADLDRHGLVTMGALHDERETVVLVGMGTGAWAAFTSSSEHTDGAPDPLDRWSKRVLGDCASRFGATGVDFPSDGPPYPPFIRWALDTGRFWQSPTGMLVHDTFGLMLSLRGALRFAGEWDLPTQLSTNPCDVCEERPCLSACPVSALSDTAPYDVSGCKSHLHSPEGRTCMSGGCLARQACPVSQTHPRAPEQSAFHMRAFVGEL